MLAYLNSNANVNITVPHTRDCAIGKVMQLTVPYNKQINN